MHFKIHGQGKKNLNGDGLAVWYSKERMQTGACRDTGQYWLAGPASLPALCDPAASEGRETGSPKKKAIFSHSVVHLTAHYPGTV